MNDRPRLTIYNAKNPEERVTIDPTTALGKRLIQGLHNPSKKGGAKGARIRWGSPEERAARWEDYQAACDQLHARRPELSWNSICENVANANNVDPKTIQRHCRKPW